MGIQSVSNTSVLKRKETLEIWKQKTPTEIKLLLCWFFVVFFYLFSNIKMSLTNTGLVATHKAELKDNTVNEACTGYILNSLDRMLWMKSRKNANHKKLPMRS